MVCKNCGAELTDEMTLCPECGVEITPDAEPEKETLSAEEPVTEEAAEETITEEASEITDALDEEDFDVDLYDVKNAKTPLAFRIAAIAVAAILVIAAGMFAFYGFFRPDMTPPFASWFDDGVDSRPIIYTKDADGKYGLYIGETQLVDFGNKRETFTAGRDFMCGEDDLYYIVKGELYWYNVGGKAPVKVADNVDLSSIVISANGKRALFTSTDASQTTLYSYIRGKSPKMVDILPMAQNAFALPNYGFIGQSSEFWYIKAEDGNVNGDLYTTSFLSSPKLKYADIGSVVYYSSSYDALIYTTAYDSSDNLYAKIGRNEPKLLNSDFSGAMEPIIVKAPTEGIVYIGNDGSTNSTLYFLSFDGNEKIIDTSVLAAVSVDNSAESVNPYYDYSKLVKKTNAFFYMKGVEILLSIDANAGSVPAGFDFYSSNPQFSSNGKSVAYISEGNALMVSNYDGTAWSEPTRVADAPYAFVLSWDGKYISFALRTDTGLSMNLYNVATQQTQMLSSNAASNASFALNDSKTLFFATDYNQATGIATFNYYTDGGSVTPIDTETVGLAAAANGEPLVAKAAAPGSELRNIYKINKNKELVPVATNATALNQV